MKKSAFSLTEILIVIAILAILAVVAFAVLNPAQRFNQARDSQRYSDVNSISKAIELYALDNGGQLPTAGGAALPAVTSEDIDSMGAAASTLDGIIPAYLHAIPLDPDGNEYLVGRIASNDLPMVGVTLSNGNLYTNISGEASPSGGGASYAVTGFTLINSVTDADIGILSDGGTIDKGVNPNINLRADLSNGGSVVRVRFYLDGSLVRTEEFDPYAVAGDSSGDYAPWSISPGSYTLRAVPYDASDDPGTELEISFTVTN